MSSKLTEQNESVFDRATRAAQNADSLAAQADIVQKELDRLAASAQDALDAAAAAQADAEAALKEQQGVESQLTAQLEALRDSRISIEQGYQSGEQNRRAAEAAATAAVRGPLAQKGRPASSSAVSGSGWTSPITSYNAYQGYGMRLHPVYKQWRLHSGDDYSAPCGTPMFATSSGTVSYAGPAGGYGNQIRIDHGGGMSSSYSHIDTGGMIVRTGATVTAGQQIAVVGNSGVSTGCHLHFEIRRDGVAIPPRPFLQTQGVG